MAWADEAQTRLLVSVSYEHGAVPGLLVPGGSGLELLTAAAPGYGGSVALLDVDG